MEIYKNSRIGAEERVTKRRWQIEPALQKERCTTDFERLAIRIEFELPKGMTGSTFPQNTKVDIIAKIMFQLESGPLKNCKTDKQRLEKGRKFLRSDEGKTWVQQWFSPNRVELVEVPKRKPSTSRKRARKQLTLPGEPNTPPGIEDLAESVISPVSTLSSSSGRISQDVNSAAIASPTESASSVKELPSPTVVPDFPSILCSPPAPNPPSEDVIIGSEEGGLCLQCWTIHSKRIGGPFVDLWPLGNSGPLSTVLLGDHNDEVNGLGQRLSARRFIGTFAIGGAFAFGALTWLLRVAVGSHPRQR